jgi:hypothetical protein
MPQAEFDVNPKEKFFSFAQNKRPPNGGLLLFMSLRDTDYTTTFLRARFQP